MSTIEDRGPRLRQDVQPKSHSCRLFSSRMAKVCSLIPAHSFRFAHSRMPRVPSKTRPMNRPPPNRVFLVADFRTLSHGRLRAAGRPGQMGSTVAIARVARTADAGPCRCGNGNARRRTYRGAEGSTTVSKQCARGEVMKQFRGPESLRTSSETC
jgi:hypothetical protein